MQLEATKWNHEQSGASGADPPCPPSDPGNSTALDGTRWRLAKLPVDKGGLGLQDLTIIADAQYMAALGQVRRAAERAVEGGYQPAAKVLEWFSDNNELEVQLDSLAETVNADLDTPICPNTVDEIASMPKAKKLTDPIYEKSHQDIITDPNVDKEDKAYIISGAQDGAGDWIQAVPSLKIFRTASHTYKTGLQKRLCINPAFADEITKCGLCDTPVDLNMRRGRHWDTCCVSGGRNHSHNKLRDIIKPMYDEISKTVQTEVGGLYATIDPEGNRRPADLLESTNSGHNHALDVTIRDPTAKTYITQNSHRHPLVAARKGHDQKMADYNKAVQQAGAQGLPFTLTPLAFETTGAMGEETQKWFKKMVSRNAEISGEDFGETTSRMQKGEPCTWTANSFSSFWKQRLSFYMMVDRATKTSVHIGKSLPKTYRDWTTGG